MPDYLHTVEDLAATALTTQMEAAGSAWTIYPRLNITGNFTNSAHPGAWGIHLLIDGAGKAMNRRVAFGLAKKTTLPNPAHRAPASSPADHLSVEDARLLERFTAEVFASALSCTAILSCLNIIQFDRAIVLPTELRTYLPLNPMTFTAVAGSEISDLLHHETRNALSGYQYYLEAGKRLLSGHLEPGRAGVTLEFLAFKAVQTPCNTASLFALLAVKDLARLYRDTGSAKWASDLAKLACDLDAATRGGSPYFVNRQFHVPGADEQMRGMRLQLNSEAMLGHQGTVRKVLIRDISQGGLGIEGVEAMQPGSRVTLQLPTGRQLNGEVCWQEGARAGINLSERLALSDPLMCA